MLERNRNQVVSKDDISRLEEKIKDLESQILTTKTTTKSTVANSKNSESLINSKIEKAEIILQTTKELEHLKEQYDLLLVNEESMEEETP
jgi:predicted  nucleic acid-binding Zn-ribbon protein